MSVIPYIVFFHLMLKLEFTLDDQRTVRLRSRIFGSLHTKRLSDGHKNLSHSSINWHVLSLSYAQSIVAEKYRGQKS